QTAVIEDVFDCLLDCIDQIMKAGFAQTHLPPPRTGKRARRASVPARLQKQQRRCRRKPTARITRVWAKQAKCRCQSLPRSLRKQPRKPCKAPSGGSPARIGKAPERRYTPAQSSFS